MGRILSPSKNAPQHDLVYTPHELAKEIIDHFSPSGLLLDPSRGGGAFYDQFPENTEKYYCEIEEGLDFFDFSMKVDWIITNPPWSKIRQFILHGMQLSTNIVYLASLNHFTTKARLRDLRENGFGIREIYGVKNPKTFPSSGFQLAAVHLQKIEDEYLPIKLTGNIGR